MLGFDTIHSNGIFTDFSAEFGELIARLPVGPNTPFQKLFAPPF